MLNNFFIKRYKIFWAFIFLTGAFLFVINTSYFPRKEGHGSCVDKFVIFARIANDVQYFHPSDAVENTNWNEFVEYGMRYISDSKENDFAKVLYELFRDIAPTIKINNIILHNIDVDKDSVVVIWKNLGYVELPSYNSEFSSYYRKRVKCKFSTLEPKDRVYKASYGKINVEIPLFQEVAENGKVIPTSKPFNKNLYSVNDSDFQFVCLASLSKIWGVIQNFSPYVSNQTKWDKELPKLLNTCSFKSSQKSFQALRVSLTKLQDNHVDIIANDEYFPEFSAPVGVSLVDNKAIISYKPQSSKDRIKIGDEIIKVDNKPLKDEINKMLPISLRSPNRQKDYVVSNLLLRRNRNEKILLTLKSKNNVSYFATLVSTEKANEISKQAIASYIFSNNQLFYEVEKGIYYINISKLAKKDVSPIIERLISTKAKGLIIDMRGYPHDWFGWQNLLSHFVKNPVSSMPLYFYHPIKPNRSKFVLEPIAQSIEAKKPNVSIPIVVLCSKFTVSQAEHVLGYVQNMGLPIIGEPTYGINGDVSWIKVSNWNKKLSEIYVSFTGLKVLQNNMDDFIGVGILPNIKISVTQEDILNRTDRQLQTAVLYLKNSNNDMTDIPHHNN